MLLPIDTTKPVTVSGGRYTYQFQDPNNVNFQYNFNAGDMNVNGNSSNGLGYFGTSTVAAPNFFCANPTNQNNGFSGDFPNWLSTINSNIDLRAFYVSCQLNRQTNQWSYKRIIPDEPEVLNSNSSYSGSPVAYTTEALYYAQSGYFVTVVMVQWSNVFACKSRKCSLIYSGVNKHMFGGVACETVLFIVLLYVPGISGVFGGRSLEFFLLGIPGLLSSMLLLCW